VTGEVKGATVNIQHDVFIITSNYTIDEVFGPGENDSHQQRESKQAMVQAIKERFKV